MPNAPSAIQFSIGNPDFDSQDLSLVRDAFEVSLLDEFGNSLVSTLGPGQDSFLNVSEEIGVRSASGIQVNGSTFLVGLNGLPIGAKGSIVFRLLNNDDDTKSNIRIIH